ncbi:MAG: 23S rRNA (uracil(1939)-C(5))-methyltransferase RlmD [Betaproteobacteria bacterium]|nr:23S rRNA (uracil(1939)-C(5))-methyltransferase RlmD [Betaproteobacteria bacterium]
MEVLSVLALDAEGRGVARNAQGKVVFVEGALGGETVDAQQLRDKRKFDLARATRILEPASGRRDPHCPHFGRCGGCATQHADARTQMAAKQRGLEDCLSRIGKVKPESLLPIVYGAEWGYRRRARFSARYVESKGGALVGFRERRSTFVADTQSCAVLPPGISALIVPLRGLVASLSVRERLPQIEVAAGEGSTVLLLRHLEPLSTEDEALVRAFADRHRVNIWLQPEGQDSARPFWPQAHEPLYYELPEFGLRVSFQPSDFTQVNFGVNRVLVSRALRMLDPRPGERIADLFCGLGNFTLPIAARGAEVIGFEASVPLIERARQNALANNVVAQFEVADLFKPDIGRFGRFDKFLIDPPREGAAGVVHALPDQWPRRIVYVSCDPATLARDADTLVNAKGFRLVSAGVMNMFPHTAHVESMALFER